MSASTDRVRGATARGVALRVIRRVVEDGAYSNLTLASELGASNLDARDRRFAAELAYGTLRRMRTIDAAIGLVATRPLDRIDPETLSVLRLGAYQILFTRVPAHAAVSETVAAAPVRSKGFANAVLRRLAARPPAPASRDGDDDGAIADRAGLAPWAVGELRRVLPGGEVEAAAAAMAASAPLTLRVNHARATRERVIAALRADGYHPMPGRHDPDVVRVPSATPATLPGYREGWFVVQDEASAIVAAALAARPGERVLDACAGPGGKASSLAVAVGPGGSVVAADASDARARLVTRAAERLGLRIPTVVQDARSPALAAATFDAVLVDAPCSGLGATRRRPELLWRVPKDRLSSLARLQVAILIGVADLVRPGGRIVYSVCTFPRAETDAVVRAFLTKRKDFEPLDVQGPDGAAPAHRLWPHRHGTDGMFYAGLHRRGGGPGRMRPRMGDEPTRVAAAGVRAGHPPGSGIAAIR